MTCSFDLKKAKIESQRCLFCYDAPCIQACPTEIDIPSFIRKISTENFKGAATDILKQNIMGGTCARVCPVETLCEEVCVRNTLEGQPVPIGHLQRFAVDWFFNFNSNPSSPIKKSNIFHKKASTGKKIAVVGAGPTGLSCAHRLALYGHSVVIFEVNSKAGGLNEYGLASYKMTDDWAQKEINFILEIGDIDIRFEQKLGRDFTLTSLQKQYDAVFLAFGLNSTNSLGVEGEEALGVVNAIDIISQIRQSKDLEKKLPFFPIPQKTVVIGGGNTAIDMAIQLKILGVEEVNLVYRRKEEQMKATSHERALAKDKGVFIRTDLQPTKIIYNILQGNKKVIGVEFNRDNSKIVLAADMVFKAIGQNLCTKELGDISKILTFINGKIAVNEKQQTNLSGIFAGGDCVNHAFSLKDKFSLKNNRLSENLTVVSVQHGKIAADSIHSYLQENFSKKGK